MRLTLLQRQSAFPWFFLSTLKGSFKLVAFTKQYLLFKSSALIKIHHYAINAISTNIYYIITDQ